MTRCLCAGESRANSDGLLGGLGEFGVGHFLDVAAEEHGVGGEADVLADLAADELVIAGEDFHGDAVFVQGGEGAGGGLLGRVEESDIAFEDEVALVLLSRKLSFRPAPWWRRPGRGSRRR